MKENNCSKCGYKSEDNIKKFDFYLCRICSLFSPDDLNKLKEYIQEKIPFETLDSFRKNYKSPGEPQKKGMLEKATKGEVMSRAPFGYRIEDKKLIPAENYDEIREIFEEFLKEKISLRSLARKHKLSVNGLKKILRNFTYLGKVKFDQQIHQGAHQAIISPTLFNQTQNKLERLGIKKN
jgi:hypothetical protein